MTSSLKKKFEELAKLAQDIPEEPPPPISDEKRDKILSDLIGSVQRKPEFNNLARALAGPIRQRIDYQSVGRKTFLTGKLCNLCGMEIPDDQEHADENECMIAKIHDS